MRIRTFCACSAISLAAWCAGARGEPLAASSVPEDARWLMHIDMDAFRESRVMEAMETRLPALIGAPGAFIGPGEKESPIVALKRIQAFAGAMGLKWPDGLHDITLFGSSFEDADACLRIHGEMDPQITIGILKNDAEFKQETYNGHMMVTWRDPGRNRLMHAAFANEMVLMSSNSKTVEVAVDAWDKKIAGLKADSVLLPGAVADAGSKGPLIVWMAGQNLSEVPDAQSGKSPLLTQMETATIAMSFDPAGTGNGTFSAQMRVVAKTEEAAKQMQAMAVGVKALAALAAAPANAPPQSKFASKAMQGLTVSQEGKNVQANWNMGIDQVEGMMPAAGKGVSGAAPKELP